MAVVLVMWCCRVGGKSKNGNKKQHFVLNSPHNRASSEVLFELMETTDTDGV